MAEYQLVELDKQLAALDAMVESATKDWMDATDPWERRDLKNRYYKIFDDATERRKMIFFLQEILVAKLPVAGGCNPLLPCQALSTTQFMVETLLCSDCTDWRGSQQAMPLCW